MSEKNKFIGLRYQSDTEPTVVYCAPENQKEVARRGYGVGDIIEATARYLVDHEGFSTRSFTVSECKNDEHPGELVCRVEFIDDGIVMAKMHGILK